MENEELENQEPLENNQAPIENEQQEPENALDSFLDTITDEDPAQGGENDQDPEKGEKLETKAITPAGEKTEVDPETDPAEKKAAADPETPEQMEKELLEEVKSERGQRRVRALMDDHKALQQQFDDVKKTNEDFSNILTETRLSPEGFAQVIEFSRLLGQGGEQNMRVALQMIDAQRAEICKQLGVKAPGVDPLSDFQDLRMAVENMELSEDRAIELAKLRRAQAQQQQNAKMQGEQERQQQEYTQRVQNFSTQAQSLFQQLQVSDPAYKAKEMKIAEALQNPAFVQNLLSNFGPEQWIHQLKFMYDNIQVAPAVKRQVPLRSRPTQTGAIVNSSATGADRIGQIFDSLGI